MQSVGSVRQSRGDAFSVQFAHDLMQVDLVWRARQHMASLRTSPALDESALVQGGHQAFEVCFRYALPVGDRRGLHRAVSVAHCKLNQCANAIIYSHRDAQNKPSVHCGL